MMDELVRRIVDAANVMHTKKMEHQEASLRFENLLKILRSKRNFDHNELSSVWYKNTKGEIEHVFYHGLVNELPKVCQSGEWFVSEEDAKTFYAAESSVSS